jgi:hypothetical protein
MEISGQLQAPDALPPGKEPPVPTGRCAFMALTVMLCITLFPRASNNNEACRLQDTVIGNPKAVSFVRMWFSKGSNRWLKSNILYRRQSCPAYRLFLSVPRYAANLLTNSAIISFSRRILLQGVGYSCYILGTEP